MNNALGQALLTRRLGKTRVIAETGAGQHGVATATACALLGLPCVVYMGAEDIRRQAPNVLRMHALGAEVRPVTSGSATLKDAVNEAMRDWVTNVETTHYVLGSAMGPHPYPTIVRDLQRRIGDEAAAQLEAVEGRLPDLALACVGGGSNAIGLLSRFIGEPIGPAGRGRGGRGRHRDGQACGGARGRDARHPPRLAARSCSRTATARSSRPTRLSAGLDYPGIGPQIAALAVAGRVELAAATDDEAVAGDAPRRGDRGDPARARDRPRDRGACRGCSPASRGPAWRTRTRRSSSSASADEATRTSAISSRAPRRHGLTSARRAPAPRPAAGRTTPPARGGSRRPSRQPGRTAAPRSCPYVVAGYPDAEASLAVALAAADAGADLLELGLPYSDPLADGATLQRASGAGARRRRDPGAVHRAARAGSARPGPASRSCRWRTPTRSSAAATDGRSRRASPRRARAG